MATFIIVDGFGNQFGGTSTSEVEIAKMAQDKANDRGESVYYTSTEEDYEPVEVSPVLDMSALVLLEVMPAQHRASHTAAGNRGSYPANGAERYLVGREAAEALVECDGEWVTIKRDAKASDEGRYPVDRNGESAANA